MTKNQIIRELMMEAVENEKLLELDSAPDGVEERIKRLKDAVEVIKSLPPRCKRCDDKTFVKNTVGEIINCPECNPYGEAY